jgi:deoxyribose-phosphate aldolase
MNTIEFSHYDIASNEAEFKDIVGKATQLKPSVISVLPSYTKLAKNIIPESIVLSSIIDYPFGILDIKSRLASTEYAIKNGSKMIELVAPSFLLCNRKYDKFREDILSHQELCSKDNVELRYVLEYRVFTSDLLCKIAQILVGAGITVIYPSTGHLLDDISDNILASALINQKVANINIIINGNMWNNRHTQTIKANKRIFGCKTNSVYTLENLVQLRSTH